MISWPDPHVPAVPGSGGPLRLHNTVTGQVEETAPGPVAGLYVCGITPYDATHLGHAATYIAFDLLNRAWRDAGHDVRYVQNVTDVDDPLLERAAATGIGWRDLADREISLFRDDMTALGVLAPDHYLGVVESLPLVRDAVLALRRDGAAYPVESDDAGPDHYFDLSRDDRFGSVSGLDREQMLALFAERGGDPERPGKRDPLDPLLWRAARPGEPAWSGGELGDGRPGWHIECTALALEFLDQPFDVTGGGSDLVFPHHEMGASHAHVISGKAPMATAFVHSGMVGLDGEKMSKSQGNLVLVSALRAADVDPMAIRLALLAHHYRADWTWTDADLSDATARLARWREALSTNGGPDPSQALSELRERIADDLDAPGALAVIDRWAEQNLDTGGDVEGAPGVLARAVDAILGVRISLVPSDGQARHADGPARSAPERALVMS